MSIKIEQCGGFNVFEWDALKCPICQGGDFISQDHSAVWCDSCNAKFQTRHTAGDPGVVIDCCIASEERAYVYAPSYECKECGIKKGIFEWQDKACKCNGELMERERGVSRPWTVPEGFGNRYCLILKIGDYCSGWGNGERRPGESRIPTQTEWEQYQEQIGR